MMHNHIPWYQTYLLHIIISIWYDKYMSGAINNTDNNINRRDVICRPSAMCIWHRFVETGNIIYTVYPINMYMVLLYMFYCGFIISSHWIWEIHLPIFFWVTSLVLGQSYDCPSTSEVTLKNMGYINHYLITTKYGVTKMDWLHILWNVL